MNRNTFSNWASLVAILIAALAVLPINWNSISAYPLQKLDGYLVNSEYQTLEVDDRLLNSKAAGGAYHTFTARTRNTCELEFLQTHDSLDRDSIDYCKKNPEGYSPEHWKYDF